MLCVLAVHLPITKGTTWAITETDDSDKTRFSSETTVTKRNFTMGNDS